MSGGPTPSQTSPRPDPTGDERHTRHPMPLVARKQALSPKPRDERTFIGPQSPKSPCILPHKRVLHKFVLHILVYHRKKNYICTKNKSMEQPFVFGVPAEDPHFIGREKEMARLEANFRYGVNTVLMSPRRWGKTSLVNKVARSVNDRNRIVVRMDIFACRSEYDFYNAFSAAILQQTASKVDVWQQTAYDDAFVPEKKLSFLPFR